MGNSPDHGPDAGDDHRASDVPSNPIVTVNAGKKAITLGDVSISRRWLRAMFFINILTAALAILLLALGLKTLSAENQRLSRGAKLAAEATERIFLEVREQARLNACLTLKVAKRHGVNIRDLDSPACHVGEGRRTRDREGRTPTIPFPPGFEAAPNGHVEETAPQPFPGEPAPPQQPTPPPQSPQPGPPPAQPSPQPSPSPTLCIPVLDKCV